ncbi:MAG TPA: hypothetical protein VG406_09510 [Isosphaeraceae bacterium]|jgi:hypothetical protein|nr:hypothetical protein [Isosphaeraceae bacterium]
MTTERERELTSAVESDAALPKIVEQLREFKHRGVSRQEVYALLESLRENARDDVLEDRILEVMDFVSGFCSADWDVWAE